jgi:hypothetical protein
MVSFLFMLLLLSGCGDLRDNRSTAPATGDSEGPSQPLTLATDDEIERSEVEPGSYIVAFRGIPGSTLNLFRSFRDEVRHNWVSLSEAYLSDPRVRDIRYITSVNLATGHEPSAKKQESFLPRALQLAWTRDDLEEIPAVISQVDFASSEVATEVLKEWELTGDIWFAEPNGLSNLSDVGPRPLVADGFEKAYRDAAIEWHKLIKLENAIAKVASVSNPFRPVIAILDSGVDTAHPDLKDQIWARPGYAPDQADCGDDQFGCDTTKARKDQMGVGQPWPYLTNGPGESCQTTSDPNKTQKQNEKEYSTCGHGTHVAGLVAGRLNVKIGDKAGGACPWCQILPIKIIKAKDAKSSGQASDAAILAAMKYLTKFREEGKDRSYVRVANSSFGKYARSRAVALMVSILSAPPHDILVVGAAGNEDSIKRSYPGALGEALGVASVEVGSTPIGTRSGFSNYGPWVDVAAPGSKRGTNGLNSTFPGGENYGEKQGTSMAAPVVSGVAGLVLALPENQNLSSQQLKDRLTETSDTSIYVENNQAYYITLSGDGAPTPLLGSGLIDAEAALNGTRSGASTARTRIRVDEGCGVAGVVGSEWTPWLTWAILATPLGVLFMMRLRYSRPSADKHHKLGRSV